MSMRIGEMVLGGVPAVLRGPGLIIMVSLLGVWLLWRLCRWIHAPRLATLCRDWLAPLGLILFALLLMWDGVGAVRWDWLDRVLDGWDVRVMHTLATPEGPASRGRLSAAEPVCKQTGDGVIRGCRPDSAVTGTSGGDK
ncbi:hypothetical protein [Serratia fonticola]|uniref:hypothetical protein n=1 Tax=Serratia fonticola TaxID=47917 RepID=UPI00301BB1C4